MLKFQTVREWGMAGLSPDRIEPHAVYQLLPFPTAGFVNTRALATGHQLPRQECSVKALAGQ